MHSVFGIRKRTQRRFRTRRDTLASTIPSHITYSFAQHPQFTLDINNMIQRTEPGECIRLCINYIDHNNNNNNNNTSDCVQYNSLECLRSGQIVKSEKAESECTILYICICERQEWDKPQMNYHCVRFCSVWQIVNISCGKCRNFV